MEDMVVVAGRVCTNPVLVYAGHLEGRMLVLSLLGCFVGMETAGVKLGSHSFKLRPGCTGEDDMTSAFASHGVNYLLQLFNCDR
jgi:hypothetical protein